MPRGRASKRGRACTKRQTQALKLIGYPATATIVSERKPVVGVGAEWMGRRLVADPHERLQRGCEITGVQDGQSLRDTNDGQSLGRGGGIGEKPIKQSRCSSRIGLCAIGSRYETDQLPVGGLRGPKPELFLSDNASQAVVIAG